MEWTPLKIVVAVAVFIAITWVLLTNDLLLYRHFAPRYEAARRETFEQSKAYRQGTIQDLQHARMNYENATPEHKDAIRDYILHVAADFPLDQMPDDLQNFVMKLRNQEALK